MAARERTRRLHVLGPNSLVIRPERIRAVMLSAVTLRARVMDVRVREKARRTTRRIT